MSTENIELPENLTAFIRQFFKENNLGDNVTKVLIFRRYFINAENFKMEWFSKNKTCRICDKILTDENKKPLFKYDFIEVCKEHQEYAKYFQASLIREQLGIKDSDFSDLKKSYDLQYDFFIRQFFKEKLITENEANILLFKQYFTLAENFKREWNKKNETCHICDKVLTDENRKVSHPKDFLRVCKLHEQYADVFQFSLIRNELGLQKINYKNLEKFYDGAFAPF